MSSSCTASAPFPRRISTTCTAHSRHGSIHQSCPKSHADQRAEERHHSSLCYASHAYSIQAQLRCGCEGRSLAGAEVACDIDVRKL